MQLAVSTINAMLDSIEVDVGTSPILRIYNGTIPASCAASVTGTLLAQGTLPSDWLANAASGSKAMVGTWTLTGQSGAGAGTNATHYRIYESTGTTCKQQGPVSAVGGGAEVTLDNINIANNQSINVASFTYGDTVNA